MMVCTRAFVWPVFSGDWMFHVICIPHSDVRKSVFGQVRDFRLRLVLQKLLNVETLYVSSLAKILSKERITKALIRLRGRAGWSAPLLFAFTIRFSHAAAYNHQ